MNIIREMIDTGDLKPGDSIIPERELCSIQSVSRMTVNKAIVSLVNEGLLYRVQGKGTFVSDTKTKNRFSSVRGFTEVMKEKGIYIKTDILSFEDEEQDEYIKKILNVSDENEQVYKVERLRYIQDEPFGIEISYIPKFICENLKSDLQDDKSLYSILNKKYKQEIIKAEQTIEPIMLSNEEAKVLNQEPSTLALKIKRTSYKEGNIPIEYTISIFRSDKYQYEIVLNK